jgi:prepilin signal peptidase PulO-like enzyme (type II secretory pathway)
MFSFALLVSISSRVLSILNTDLISVSHYTLKQVETLLGFCLFVLFSKKSGQYL